MGVMSYETKMRFFVFCQNGRETGETMPHNPESVSSVVIQPRQECLQTPYSPDRGGIM